MPVKLVASPDIYQLNGAWVEACTISWRFWIFPCYFCTFLARLGYFLRAFLAISWLFLGVSWLFLGGSWLFLRVSGRFLTISMRFWAFPCYFWVFLGVS